MSASSQRTVPNSRGQCFSDKSCGLISHKHLRRSQKDPDLQLCVARAQKPDPGWNFPSLCIQLCCDPQSSGPGQQQRVLTPSPRRAGSHSPGGAPWGLYPLVRYCGMRNASVSVPPLTASGRGNDCFFVCLARKIP